MCVLPKGPSQIAQNAPAAPPPPPPPPPAPTTSSLTVGDQRAGAPPIKNFLRKSLGTKRNSLVIPVGGTDAAAGSGVNIPG